MTFDTAVFYDIENLIGGYSKAEMLPSLSLVDINRSVSELDIGKIAIQRAYANWNTPRLNVLRDDIVTLGINPVQMFGFGRGADKNASDIQMVIDAIDIACNRPNINNFVIVSGDGGFSPLAIKLHEYGKRVVGVGYQRITNRVLESVCDDFIWLYDPIAQKPVSVTTTVNNAPSRQIQQFTDPILISYANSHEPLTKPDNELILSEGLAIVEFLANHQPITHKLKKTGLNISILIQLFKYRLGELKYPSFGFVKQIDFVNHIVSASSCKLVLSAPSEYRLALKDFAISGFEDVSPIEQTEDMHTTERYLELLKTGVPSPHIRLPERIVVHDIARYILANPDCFHNVCFTEVCQQLDQHLTYQLTDIEKGASALLLSSAFSHEQTGTGFITRNYSLACSEYSEMLQHLENTMHEKLMQVLGEVKEEPFAALLSLESNYAGSDSH